MENINKKSYLIDLDSILGKPDETGFNLIPFDDDNAFEKTKKVCMHLRRKHIKFQTFEYDYCFDCKKEIKE